MPGAPAGAPAQAPQPAGVAQDAARGPLGEPAPRSGSPLVRAKGLETPRRASQLHYSAPGETGGVEEVTLTVSQVPAHSHVFLGSTNTGTGTAPADSVLCNLVSATNAAYGTDNPQASLDPTAVSAVGGSQPHTNFQPYLCVNFIIALFGIFPSPT